MHYMYKNIAGKLFHVSEPLVELYGAHKSRQIVSPSNCYDQNKLFHEHKAEQL